MFSDICLYIKPILLNCKNVYATCTKKIPVLISMIIEVYVYMGYNGYLIKEVIVLNSYKKGRA